MLTRLHMAVRALLRRDAVESEMQREMRLHIELETEENLRRGMTPGEARRAALVSFGGVEKAKEDVRDERTFHLLEAFLADLRFALRSMIARPLFALTIVVLIAVGTGVNTAVFSMVHRLVLRPLPFPDADRMVALTATAGGGKILVTPPRELVAQWVRRARQVEEIRVSSWGARNLGDTANPIARDLEGAALTPGLMSFVGMKPFIGRDILTADTARGAPRVAILGYKTWKKYFDGRHDVLGKSILLDGESHTIVGVAPPGFYVPYSGGKDMFTALESGFRWEPIGKLRPGATVADAERELTGIWKSMGSALPTETLGDPPRLQTTADLVFASNRRMLIVLFGAVGLVLLTACANVANLMLSRAWSRQREFGVRAAMGASRARLTAQLLTETLLYSVLGAVLGFLIAMGILKVLVVSKASALQGLEEVEMNGVVMAWTTGLCLLTALLVGLAPALLVGDGRIGEVLKAATRSSSASSAARRFRATLVVTEVALSVVLLVGTGMLARTLVEMSRADTGFRPQGLSAISLQMRGPTFADSLQRRALLSSVLTSVRRAPGIRAATYAMSLPPRFAIGMAGVEIEGRPFLARDSVTTVKLNAVAPDYFQITGTTIREGRAFAADTRPISGLGTDEIMVNQRFAMTYWPDGSAIGARLKYGKSYSKIVGVVNDVDLPGEPPKVLREPQIYVAMPGAPRQATIVVSSSLAKPVLDSVLRRAIREGNALVKAGDLVEANEQFRLSRLSRNGAVGMLGAFAVLALILAAIGLYAVMSYSVAQRTREIGIRLALGARPDAIARLVLTDGVRMAGLGIVLGAGAAIFATRVMGPLLYRVSPGDPISTAGSVMLLLIVALVACALPARRATRVDPVELVRAE